MDSDADVFKKLIKKIDSGLSEIQTRSINTIHNKITLAVFDFELLPAYPQFPGILMTWINSNRHKNQTLFKVLQILTYYTKTEQGLLLLKQYECLQFLEEFKQYLITHENNVHNFIQIIDAIIRSLLPLGRTQPQEKEEVKQKEERIVNEGSGRKEERILPSDRLEFRVAKFDLSEKKQKMIFDLVVQLKYGKKDLQYETLMEIKSFLFLYSKYHFRCKNDLFVQLVKYADFNLFPWLVCQIITILLQGLCEAQKDEQNSDFSLHNKIVCMKEVKVYKINTVEVQVTLPHTIFKQPQSYQILCLINKNVDKFSVQWVSQIEYKYSGKFIGQIMKSIPNSQIERHCLSTIENTCEKDPSVKDYFLSILSPTTINKIPSLSLQKDKNISFKHFKLIEKYLSIQSFGSKLEIIPEIIAAIEKGKEAISLHPGKIILFYINLFLTLGVSVGREDPIMSYYPTMRDIILEVSGHEKKIVRLALYEQILRNLNSQETIGYLKKEYRRNEVMEMILSEEKVIGYLLERSLEEEECTQRMLQVMKVLILHGKESLKKKYVQVLFALSHHGKKRIRELSEFGLEKIAKKDQVKAILLQLFSSNKEVRMSVLNDFINFYNEEEQTVDDLLLIILQNNEKNSNSKKPLKISTQSIINYINLILNPSLQPSFRISASEELADCLERANPQSLPQEQLQHFHQILIEKISKIFSQKRESNECALNGHYVHLYYVLNQKMVCWEQLGIQILASLLGFIKEKKHRIELLFLIYEKAFEDPFSPQKGYTHWIYNYYPHLTIKELKIRHPQVVKEDQKVEIVEQKEKQVGENIYEVLLHNLINKRYKEIDVGQLQKEIVQSLSAHNHYYISSLSSVIERYPKKPAINAGSITSSLMNYLFANRKLQQCYEINLIALMGVLGFQRNKQAESIVNDQKRNLTNQLILLSSMPSNSQQQIQNIMKLTNSDLDSLNLFHIYTILLKSCLKNISQYSLLCLLQSIQKCIKNLYEEKVLLISLLLLQKILRSNCDISTHKSTLLTILTHNFSQMELESGILLLINDCICLLLRDLDEGSLSIVNIIISKAVPFINYLSTSRNQNYIPLCSFFSIINRLLGQVQSNDFLRPSLKQILGGIDLIDTGISLLGKVENGKECWLMVDSITQFLLQWQNIEPSIVQYMLISTQILMQLFRIIKQFSHEIEVDINQTQEESENEGEKCSFVQFKAISSVAALLLTLAKDQHRFILKLNKLINEGILNFNNLFSFLSSTLFKLSTFPTNKGERYNCSYLKMFSWLAIIWKKDHQYLQQNSLVQRVLAAFSRFNPPTLLLYRGIILTSTNGKKYFLGGEHLGKKLQLGCQLLDEIIAKNWKSKKSKKEKFMGEEENRQKIEQIILFLKALLFEKEEYLSEKQKQLSQKEKETALKLIKFIEKLYTLLQISQSHHFQHSFKELFQLLPNSQLISPVFTAHFAENNSGMLQDLINKILKNEEQEGQGWKDSLHLVSLLAKSQSVRSILYKSKVIEELTLKLIKMEQQKSVGKGNFNLNFIYSLSLFLGQLAVYKDANAKILNDKRVLEVFTRLLSLQLSETIEQRIVELLANLASFKQHKPVFMANKQIHKVSLGLLSDSMNSYRGKLLSLIYNIVYKNAAGLKLYRRREVIDMIKKQEWGEEQFQIYEALVEVLQADE